MSKPPMASFVSANGPSEMTVFPFRTRTVRARRGDAQIRGVRGLAAPLLRGRLERDLEANLHRIKALVEAEPSTDG